jgi:predicted CoA-binding protein
LDEIGEILAGTRTIAVVGLSPDPARPSHFVSRYLQQSGYRVIPVNPNIGEALGEKSYPALEDIPERVDLVQIFRRSEFAGPFVDGAIDLGAKYVWMQDGVVDEEAADRARAAGLLVVMDDCVMRQHRMRRAGGGN